MRVKVKELDEFKPFKIELTFENIKEVNKMINLLSCTAFEIDYEEKPIYDDFKDFKDELINKSKQRL